MEKKDPTNCRQTHCDQPAAFRFTWPGTNESYCCVVCAVKLKNVAAAIGLHVQVIPLQADDYVRMMGGQL